MKRLTAASAILLITTAAMAATQPVVISAITVELAQPIPATCPADLSFVAHVTGTNPNATNIMVPIGQMDTQLATGFNQLGLLTLRPGAQTVDFRFSVKGVIQDGTANIMLRLSPDVTGVSSGAMKYTFQCTTGTTTAETCMTYDPQSLRVTRPTANGWYNVVSGQAPSVVKLKEFVNLNDALLAVSVLRKYTTHCTIYQYGQTPQIFMTDYWK